MSITIIGRMIERQTFVSGSGQAEIHVPVHHYPAGMYCIALRSDISAVSKLIRIIR